MGIYVFTWSVLRRYLIDDENNPNSQNDFGKNIIPGMLADGLKLYAYRFSGYWKDVGTISSLWEANMDLLNPASGLNLNDSSWKIYARNSAEPPHFAAGSAEIVSSIVSEGAMILGSVKRSVISHGAYIGLGASVEDSVILPGAIVKAGAVIRHAIVAEGAVIGEGAKIGEKQKGPVKGEWQIAVVGPGAKIAPSVVVAPAEMVKEGK